MTNHSTINRPGILFIGNFLSGNMGTRGVSEELSYRLREMGWTILTTSDRKRKVTRLLDMIRVAIRTRKAYQVVALEVYSRQAFIWAEILGWLLYRLKKPYLLTLHGGGLAEFAKKWPGRINQLFLKAGVITTPSHFLQEYFKHIRADIIYLPNAIEVSNYPFRLRDNPEPKLCWLRAIHKIYDPETAVNVLNNLTPDFPDASLVMIGPNKGDGSMQSITNLANRLGVSNRIEISGPIPKRDVAKWLNRHDIFLNTTKYESFGVSVMEAAACGLPIVSTNVGELPYLWEHGEELFLVPVSDPQAMADAVRAYLTSPKLASDMSVKARRKAEVHDWSRILPEWDNLFMKLWTM